MLGGSGVFGRGRTIGYGGVMTNLTLSPRASSPKTTPACRHRGQVRHGAVVPVGPTHQPAPPMPTSPTLPATLGGDPDRLWNRREAAEYLQVSERWLSDSPVPHILLPNTRHNEGAKRRRRIARYIPSVVRQWVVANLTTDRAPRKAAKPVGRRKQTAAVGKGT